MRVIIETDSYNPRRDSTPWISRVTEWAVGASRPEIVWGSWSGRPGDPGRLIIAAEPGDLVRWGQNDQRAKNHTYRQYGVVRPDGTVREVTDMEACDLAQGAVTLGAIEIADAAVRIVRATKRLADLRVQLDRGYLVVESAPLPSAVRERLERERDALAAVVEELEPVAVAEGV